MLVYEANEANYNCQRHISANYQATNFQCCFTFAILLINFEPIHCQFEGKLSTPKSPRIDDFNS